MGDDMFSTQNGDYAFGGIASVYQGYVHTIN